MEYCSAQRLFCPVLPICRGDAAAASFQPFGPRGYGVSCHEALQQDEAGRSRTSSSSCTATRHEEVGAAEEHSTKRAFGSFKKLLFCRSDGPGLRLHPCCWVGSPES